MTPRNRTPETRVEARTSLILPELSAVSLDEQFPIRPSTIDGWVDVINSRHASVMELASFTSPYIRAYAESVATTLSIASQDKASAEANKKIINAGVLYGACLDNEPEGRADLHIEPMRAANYIGVVAENYGRYANASQALFSHARRLEVEQTGSDVIATTFSAVQDHIGTIFSSEAVSREDAQVLFYLSAVAGALAAQPADRTPAATPTRLRDSLLGKDGVPAALPLWQVQPGHGLRASQTVERALASQFGFTLDFSHQAIVVTNGRLIQVLPDTCISYGPEDSLDIPFREVTRLAVELPRSENKKLDNLSSRVVLVHDLKDIELYEDGRIVGLKTRHDGLVFNSYDRVHPYKRTVTKALIGSGLRKRAKELFPEDLSRLETRVDETASEVGRTALEGFRNGPSGDNLTFRSE